MTANTENRCAIRFEHVWTRFGDKLIHKDISFCLRHGQILGLVGASGCGKTTLLREIIGLQVPSQGDIFVMGHVLPKIEGTLDKATSRISGVLFQKGALFSALDVFENIAFPLRELGFTDSGLIQRLVMMKLERVGLSAADASLKPAALSGGMIKRVALARALILEPSLLLLDEPTSGLDPIASEEFVSLLSELHRELNFTVVMVTHDLDILRDLCTQVAVLADQQLIAMGALPEVLACPHPFIGQFFHNRRAQRVFQPEVTNGQK
ncbi:ATP-binding cassette domain-containing protein [Methylosoma difficile]